MTTSNVNPPDDPATDESRGSRPRNLDSDQLDALFDALADARRRRIVRLLRADDVDSLPVDALVARLAEREPGATTDRLAVSLHHVHLPKLDAAGVVDYDRDRSTVRYERTPLVDHCLDLL